MERDGIETATPLSRSRVVAGVALLLIGILLGATGMSFWNQHVPHVRDLPVDGEVTWMTAMVTKVGETPDVEIIGCPGDSVVGPMVWQVHDADLHGEAVAGQYVPIAFAREVGVTGEKWRFMGWAERTTE